MGPHARPLAVVVDGTPLPPEEARAFWGRFSAHMDAHQGDLAGFAAAEGFASVHPEVRDGKPTLVVSRTASQRPYTTASTTSTGAARSGRPHRQPRTTKPGK